MASLLIRTEVEGVLVEERDTLYAENAALRAQIADQARRLSEAVEAEREACIANIMEHEKHWPRIYEGGARLALKFAVQRIRARAAVVSAEGEDRG